MATNRILEFTPSQDEAVVARILVLVHQAVDVHFPSAEKATRQFTKTVFSDDSERTAIGNVPTAEGFGSEERTDPGNDASKADGVGAENPAIPPPPSVRQVVPTPPPARPNPIQSRHEVAHHVSREGSANASPALASPMASTAGATTSVTGLERQLFDGPDWITRGLMALLVAGLLLLAYSLFV